ncbi:MAG: hypothetical protein V5A51_12255 [Bacteroidales bacterium]
MNLFMDRMEAAKRAKEKHEKALMRKKGVLGCAVGYKYVGDQKTDEISIICYVDKKKPEEALRKKDIIPRFLEDIRTDVIESGEMRAM